MNNRSEIPRRHLFDGSDFNVYDQQIANLSAGAPGPDLLSKCSEIFRIATDHRMQVELENNSYLFQYGPTIGTTEFRKILADFLSQGYKSGVSMSDLVQTSGATHGLHLILSTLIDFAGVIFVDEVTYMIALEVFRQFYTFKIITVPLRGDGPDLKVLAEKISEHRFKPSDNKLFWGIYYTIPTFHNPTGILFSDDINKQLIRLARSSEILIACDDVYNLLYYSSDETNSKQPLTPPKRLFAYDIDDIETKGWKGNVISNGSFSKILSPGIRLGWMECPPRCIEVFRDRMFDKETGELELGAFQDDGLYYDRETGESSDHPTLVVRRERSKFSIPKQYLRSYEQSHTRKKCCVSKVNSSYPLASREKMMHLKEEIILGYNKTSYLLLLIPPLFIMPKLALMLILLTEVALHKWAHKKNALNPNPEFYYRTPLHIVSSQFCGICRHELQMDRIVKLHDKRMKQMQNYFKRVTRTIA